MIKPDPAKTWDLVSGLDPNTLPKCQLFNPPSNGTDSMRLESGKLAPTWGTIGRKR